MQALSIKPGSRYRQLRRLQSRTGRFTKIGILPGPFFRIREDIRKGTRSDHLVFREAHKGVPSNRTGTPDGIV
jgi:hypothetical protein